MTSRDDILDKIREANLHQTSRQVQRRYEQVSTLARSKVVDLFVERVSDYGARVIRTGATEARAAITFELSPLRSDEVLLSPGLDSRWIEDGVMDAQFSNYQLDQFKAVVTTCAVSIAETGTIILDHRDDGQGRRALSLVPDMHVCIVRAIQIVHLVAEAFVKLDPRRQLTWISGPSATSDIELERVEGVHGPRDLRVILVDDLS